AEHRLDVGHAGGLDRELVAVGQEHRLAVEIAERVRSLPAADQYEPIFATVGDQRPRQLDRHREHADTLRAPTGGHIDRESGHEMNLSDRRTRLREAPMAGVKWDSGKFGLPPFCRCSAPRWRAFSFCSPTAGGKRLQMRALAAR